jgi:hypothetical protein
MCRPAPLRRRWIALSASTVVLALPGVAFAQATSAASQTVNLTLAAAGRVSLTDTVSMVAAPFQPFTGQVTVSYRVRTSPGGGGSITLQMTSDFTPTGGPSAASGNLRYTCSGATLGMACIGTQPVRPGHQYPVVAIPGTTCTGGGGQCSAADPNSVNLQFQLDNGPAYAAGTYSATLLVVISAT